MTPKELADQMNREPPGTYLFVVELVNGRAYMDELSVFKLDNGDWVYVDEGINGTQPDIDNYSDYIAKSEAVYAFS